MTRSVPESLSDSKRFETKLIYRTFKSPSVKLVYCYYTVIILLLYCCYSHAQAPSMTHLLLRLRVVGMGWISWYDQVEERSLCDTDNCCCCCCWWRSWSCSGCDYGVSRFISRPRSFRRISLLAIRFHIICHHRNRQISTIEISHGKYTVDTVDGSKRD